MRIDRQSITMGCDVVTLVFVGCVWAPTAGSDSFKHAAAMGLAIIAPPKSGYEKLTTSDQ